MVRKTKEDTQQTYDALLDAAEIVFCEKGVSNTTLNDVASAAGMTRGAIYWHFKDKKELFHALCDRAFLPIEILLNEITSTPIEDPMAAIRQLYVHFIQQATGNPRQTKVFDIIFHRCEKTAEMETFIEEREGKRECLCKVQEIFELAVAQGVLPIDTDTWIAVQITHSFLIGLVHEWLIDTNAYDLGAHGEAMIDVMLAGLSAKPPRKKI
ncbi:TetR family transcriptional regulator [Undibacterium sp. LX40W]|uniref:TetR family transcriptional regulator n=1 Tax=Undibacterium nitidum TaxID=2762298 RepID=A0A923HMA9_9BURK|nr:MULTISPECIES: TetR family transcriptional regulator [Undibacterium]MBC3880416.1 TetR family transcriptional regulator [Undibacterium nitidum]MBC3890847.1 TetR family transcriptional regulator [Undibacterium sp. LX40W]